MNDFPDVNVWVALSAADHSFHEVARNYFEKSSASNFVFSWVTAMGLIRVTNNKHTFGGAPLSPQDAWENYMRWLQRGDVKLRSEPQALADHLSHWVREGLATPKNWTDLYLAAFALGHGLRLVTFDRGFKSLVGLDVLVLEPV